MKESSSEKFEEGGDSTDLNLHTFRHYHLKVACLPIPPYARDQQNIGKCIISEVENDFVLTPVLTQGGKSTNKYAAPMRRHSFASV